MSWNHRLVYFPRNKVTKLMEVFYDDNGLPWDCMDGPTIDLSEPGAMEAFKKRLLEDPQPEDKHCCCDCANFHHEAEASCLPF